jgi:hypothetical protein
MNDEITFIHSRIQSGEPIQGISIPIESVSVFPLVGNTLYVSNAERKGVKELGFLAGKTKSWLIGKPEAALDYNVDAVSQEQAESSKKVFEAPFVTADREMGEEYGSVWPEWKKYARACVLKAQKKEGCSYIILFFVSYPNTTFLDQVKPVQGKELTGFLPLPYSWEEGKLVVKDNPQLRKFFKNILFKFYGEIIYNEFTK